MVYQGATYICNLPFPQNVEPNYHFMSLPAWDVLWIYDSDLQVLRWAGDAAAGKVVRVLLLSVRAWWKEQPCPLWLQAGGETQSSTPRHPRQQARDLGRGRGCKEAEKGQALTPLTGLARSGRALLTESFSVAEAWHGAAMPFSPCLQKWALSSLLLLPLPLN